MSDESGMAISRIQDQLRERVPPTPEGLREAIVARLEDLPAESAGSVARQPVGAVGAAAGRLRLALAAVVLVATGFALLAVTTAVRSTWARLGPSAWSRRGFPRPFRRAAPAPRSGAGAASR